MRDDRPPIVTVGLLVMSVILLVVLGFTQHSRLDTAQRDIDLLKSDLAACEQNVEQLTADPPVVTLNCEELAIQLGKETAKWQDICFGQLDLP